MNYIRNVLDVRRLRVVAPQNNRKITAQLPQGFCGGGEDNALISCTIREKCLPLRSLSGLVNTARAPQTGCSFFGPWRPFFSNNQ